MDMQRYREHHKDLLAMMGALHELLVLTELAKDGGPARKLTVHLAMEDKLLYPTRLNSGRKETSELARRYMDEMGGIKQAFSVYLSAWPSGAAIQRDVAGFIDQSRSIISALGKRIDAEEGHLYPAAQGAWGMAAMD